MPKGNASEMQRHKARDNADRRMSQGMIWEGQMPSCQAGNGIKLKGKGNSERQKKGKMTWKGRIFLVTRS